MACVFIVDDDAGALLTLRIGLQQAGYDVHTAASGEAACDFLGRAAPETLLLDLKLPGISGYEVLAWMRDHEVVVPTAAMTGYLELFEPADALALGAAMYLRKPLSLDAVLEAVSRLRRGGGSESAASHGPGAWEGSPSEDSLRRLHGRMLAGDAASFSVRLSMHRMMWSLMRWSTPSWSTSRILSVSMHPAESHSTGSCRWRPGGILRIT
jgi:DNA-binding response OmpR family regulator